jgi:DNA-binding MarR family transcriptional regulator
MNKISNNSLISLIFNANRLIREGMGKHGNVDPFSLAQFKVLTLVFEKGSPTMKEIADSLYITSPSATSIINHLVTEKELQRVFDKEDRRIVRLTLTAKGKKTLIIRRKEAAERMNKIIEPLNEKEKNQLASIFTKIINSHNQ